jgi:hypothetical protein
MLSPQYQAFKSEVVTTPCKGHLSLETDETFFGGYISDIQDDVHKWEAESAQESIAKGHSITLHQGQHLGDALCFKASTV